MTGTLPDPYVYIPIKQVSVILSADMESILRWILNERLTAAVCRGGLQIRRDSLVTFINEMPSVSAKYVHMRRLQQRDERALAGKRTRVYYPRTPKSVELTYIEPQFVDARPVMPRRRTPLRLPEVVNNKGA